MHDIEPYYHWRDHYVASEDDRSPFYGREYNEFQFTNRIYNYFIHPQWDDFGSPTLYMKILYADYDEGYAIFELIGEWNDCLQNDIMLLKREIADALADEGIHKFVLICENVLNFHGSDECYYEEWLEDVNESGGWIAVVNTLQHVEDEMKNTDIHHFIHLGGSLNEIDWRVQKPGNLVAQIESVLSRSRKQLFY